MEFFWTPCIIELRCWCDDWSSYRHFEFKMKYDDWSSNQSGIWSMMIDFPPCFPCKCHNWKYAKPSTGLGHASWRHKGIEKKNNCDFNNNLYISYEILVLKVFCVVGTHGTFQGFAKVGMVFVYLDLKPRFLKNKMALGTLLFLKVNSPSRPVSRIDFVCLSSFNTMISTMPIFPF